jgi:hypothetical protein
MKRVVEQAAGGRCLFLQGAAGDQGPVEGFQADTRVYRRLGEVLGQEAAKLALGTISIPAAVKLREVVPSGAPLGMFDCEFPQCAALPLQVRDIELLVPLREGLPEPGPAAQKLESWRTKLHEARRKGDGAAIAEATYMARRADLLLRLAEDFGGKATTGVRAHFITFGDVALVGCNIEPFCEIGMAVKQKSPFPVTTMSGYTNGRLAYMATADEWPKGGYEVENSPFGQEAGEVTVGQILKTLNEMRAGVVPANEPP